MSSSASIWVRSFAVQWLRFWSDWSDWSHSKASVLFTGRRLVYSHSLTLSRSSTRVTPFWLHSYDLYIRRWRIRQSTDVNLNLSSCEQFGSVLLLLSCSFLSFAVGVDGKYSQWFTCSYLCPKHFTHTQWHGMYVRLSIAHILNGTDKVAFMKQLLDGFLLLLLLFFFASLLIKCSSEVCRSVDVM